MSPIEKQIHTILRTAGGMFGNNPDSKINPKTKELEYVSFMTYATEIESVFVTEANKNILRAVKNVKYTTVQSKPNGKLMFTVVFSK